MKEYIVTGGCGGIGSAVKAALEAEGHKVFIIDLRNADLCGDLSTPEGRNEIIAKVHQQFPDGIDGLVCCAGVPGTCPNLKLMMGLNFYGAAGMAEGCFDLLAKRKGSCVLITSFSIAEGYTIKDLVTLALQENSEATMMATLDSMGSSSSEFSPALYITSKYALWLWMRRHVALWGEARVNLNCVAPGTTNTAMVSGMDDASKYMLNALPIPIRYGESLMLEPEEIADPICFLLSDKARAIHGANLFIDGGSEVAINTEHVY